MFKAELKDEDGSLFVLRDLELDTVNPCVGLNLSVTTDARRKAEDGSLFVLRDLGEVWRLCWYGIQFQLTVAHGGTETWAHGTYRDMQRRWLMVLKVDRIVTSGID
jgi:hypothetical protein